ncbi:MAG: hypothetical protein EZS28_000469 [Streblomastix strix]|uniref:Uncharacterized protein n=1 Tax=Streblomastix strix TaxID=222440 RepID=A0A5J4X9M2_9EUKA|nr:MAG: hypothetical protein EZS28_000469 [Streblomastix strix]
MNTNEQIQHVNSIDQTLSHNYSHQVQVQTKLVPIFISPPAVQGSDTDPIGYLLNYNPGQIKDLASACGQDELIELNRRIFSLVTKRYEMASKTLFESLVDLTDSGEKGDKLNQLRGSMLIQFRDLMSKQEEQLDEMTSEIFKGRKPQLNQFAAANATQQTSQSTNQSQQPHQLQQPQSSTPSVSLQNHSPIQNSLLPKPQVSQFANVQNGPESGISVQLKVNTAQSQQQAQQVSPQQTITQAIGNASIQLPTTTLGSFTPPSTQSASITSQSNALVFYQQEIPPDSGVFVEVLLKKKLRDFRLDYEKQQKEKYLRKEKAERQKKQQNILMQTQAQNQPQSISSTPHDNNLPLPNTHQPTTVSSAGTNQDPIFKSSSPPIADQNQTNILTSKQ